MHDALLNRAVSSILAVRRHLLFSANLRSVGVSGVDNPENVALAKSLKNLFEKAPDSTSWRVIDHCTVVTRTYAIYEEFVFSLLREYLDFLSSTYSFSELGADFALKFTRGVGQILLEQDRLRYKEIDVVKLLTNTVSALNNVSGYQLQPEALLKTEQNLRMSELQKLFGHCGLTGVEGWVANHSEIVRFFAKEQRLSQTAESELKELVEYRNEASHGEVDDVLGLEVLVEVTEYFEAILKSLKEFVQHDSLRRRIERGTARDIGYISEAYSKGRAVGKVSNASLAVSGSIYLFGDQRSVATRIESLMMNDVTINVTTVDTETEVGLGLSLGSREGDRLVQLIDKAS